MGLAGKFGTLITSDGLFLLVSWVHWVCHLSLQEKQSSGDGFRMKRETFYHTPVLEVKFHEASREIVQEVSSVFR